MGWQPHARFRSFRWERRPCSTSPDRCPSLPSRSQPQNRPRLRLAPASTDPVSSGRHSGKNRGRHEVRNGVHPLDATAQATVRARVHRESDLRLAVRDPVAQDGAVIAHCAGAQILRATILRGASSSAPIPKDRDARVREAIVLPIASLPLANQRRASVPAVIRARPRVQAVSVDRLPKSLSRNGLSTRQPNLTESVAQTAIVPRAERAAPAPANAHQVESSGQGLVVPAFGLVAGSFHLRNSARAAGNFRRKNSGLRNLAATGRAPPPETVLSARVAKNHPIGRAALVLMIERRDLIVPVAPRAQPAEAVLTAQANPGRKKNGRE